MTFLDLAEIFVGKSTGVTAVRIIISLWKALRTLAELFAEANDDGILIVESCIFKPNRDKQCEGGAL